MWSKFCDLFWKGFVMSAEKDEAVVVNPQSVDATVSAEPPPACRERKKEEWPKPSRWASNWYNYNQHYLQPDHMTREERFPLIFDSAKKLKPDARRILSFGCSTGEECQALARRFPEAEVIGLEIDTYSIQTARKKNKSDKIFFHDEIGGTGMYDLVVALMVFFCMEEAVPKDRMIANLKHIDKHLNVGGVLMLYTCDHDPTEILGSDYEPLNIWLREHNKNGRQYYNGYYRKRGGTAVYEDRLEIDPATMLNND